MILAGIRTAAVISVGTATLAAFIGAGGLGDPIVTGLTVTDTNLVLSGALPAAALAMLVDAALPGSNGWRRRADCVAGDARRMSGAALSRAPLRSELVDAGRWRRGISRGTISPASR